MIGGPGTGGGTSYSGGGGGGAGFYGGGGGDTSYPAGSGAGGGGSSYVAPNLTSGVTYGFAPLGAGTDPLFGDGSAVIAPG